MKFIPFTAMGLLLVSAVWLPPAAMAMDADAAQDLVKSNNRAKCHAPEKKKDGPSFKETAAKYKGKPEGEDRIVKDRMREAVTGGCPCPPELPCVCDAVQTVRLVRGVARTPSAAEQAGNRRASSARLRVVERISDSPTRGRR